MRISQTCMTYPWVSCACTRAGRKGRRSCSSAAHPGNCCTATCQSHSALLLPDWHCHTDTGDVTFKLVQSSQGMIWCHVPTNSSLSIKLVFPEETHFCWTTPSQLSRRAKAVCKSAPHRLFHLNDLPSLAGLSLSRACIQGNKSYQGKNGSKKLLKPQYPFWARQR